jgi:hypothetical protein
MENCARKEGNDRERGRKDECINIFIGSTALSGAMAAFSVP